MKNWSNVTKAGDVIIARFHKILYVAIKIQASVERHTEQSPCVTGLHANAGDRQARRG
jgi:hypothetical protein